jgi:2-amino-4-hydroxy-6-hydroxymethyldihydropteridine diphosphokinase
VTETAFVALGGNLGSDEEIIARFDDACAALAAYADGPVVRSPIYRSPPAGPVREQPAFLNQVVRFESALEPRPLLELLQAIEARHGRVRTVAQGPRTLDLDLLLFGERVIVEPDLVVPHPRLGHRPFVLAPLLDLLGGPPERL